jgi:hypothetical protein
LTCNNADSLPYPTTHVPYYIGLPLLFLEFFDMCTSVWPFCWALDGHVPAWLATCIQLPPYIFSTC